MSARTRQRQPIGTKIGRLVRDCDALKREDSDYELDGEEMTRQDWVAESLHMNAPRKPGLYSIFRVVGYCL